MKSRSALLALLLAIATTAAPAVIAAPAHYEVDPQHTFPSFEFSHMGISVWRGRFDRSRGTVAFDRKTGTGSVDITVDTASISFGLDEMDEHARSPEWFDVAKYPTATYKGKLRAEGGVPKAVDGEFTFRGQTKPLTLAIRQFKCIPHPMLRREVCGADAEGELNWGEWGMSKSEYGKGEAGRVKLRIQVEAIQRE